MKLNPYTRKTHSLCPVCKAQIPAAYVRKGDDIYLKKTCPEHGGFSVIAWRGADSFYKWVSGCPQTEENPLCPAECGLCGNHLRETCCAILDVTDRCNLNCSICFAQCRQSSDRGFDDVRRCLDDMARKGIRYIYFSGGEPTVRDDLPALVRYAAALGFEYIQLNTNGLRIAREDGYAAKMADAGVSVVFLQFDGMDDRVYRALRGKALLNTKLECVRRCEKAGLGVVLVPTVVPKVNDDNLGDIIMFALQNRPVVRGVHFQPVTYFGKYPNEPSDSDRITLPELMRLIEEQTRCGILASHFAPSCCDHPLCGFHAEYRVENRKVTAAFGDRHGVLSAESAAQAVKKNQRYVRLRWAGGGCCAGAGDESTIDGFLSKVYAGSFTVSAMAFQDIYNADLGRIRSCSIHVYNEGRLIPFCANHIYHNSQPV